MTETPATPQSATESIVQGAHLVGSVNLPDAEAVFRAAAGRLGDHLARIPDGEVGERYYWIQFQGLRFDATPGLVRVGDEGGRIRGQFDARKFGLDGTVAAPDLAFPDLGYATAALESYAVFSTLRTEGVIASGVRFQVSLPTPAAVMGSFLRPEDRAAVEPVYERALFAELERILDGIPHTDLAIQWDTAVEFALLEPANQFGLASWFEPVLPGVVERALRQLDAVPVDVQAGYHLCYGDVEEAHFAQPVDAGNLAAVMQGIFEGASRHVDFVHLPVPIERDDVEYFAPLAGVLPSIPASTDVYLGLVHHEDGAEGARRRIAAASAVLPHFGVATECGFGRGPAERTVPLLDLHAAVSLPW
ncbi:hypothetical protein [Frondihabitans australicus]|uniref:Methionine synthase II (Cobalamin-independent) n=1 Tax=Frondihabitans australicus TaxID=386892 RepID=A0A495IH62_9MICO|nr:hypothetical protein [Frondihabitans australicus]RKR74661.1 hypothetical protein C8E83_1788 [Frondihabitans australicus]